MNKIGIGFIWKTCERFGVSGVQFILQIILARLLSPEHYGVLSIMIIFISIANVFVQNGFNTALIQNKDVTEEDYSSVLWISICVASGLYIIIYFFAPTIARFYEMPDIVIPLRILALMLFPGALNSVQLAKVSKQMDFRKVFFSNIGAVLISGIVGIIIALCGGGLWALVIQTLLNVSVACVVMFFSVKIKWHLRCDLKRIKILFAYGWKLLTSSLLETLYQDLCSLIIGKKYNSDTLGYYNRGKHFPQFFIKAVNGSVQSVMLPAMSTEQDDVKKVKELMRNSVMLSSYIIFPIMAGLAAIAVPLVTILLKEKWLPCVPYMQIYCLTLAFYPISSCNLQAINAIGRSDIFLKLEVIKKLIGVIIIMVAVFCFDTPIAIAMTGAFTSIISCFINAYPNKSLIGYSYVEQAKDMLPAFIASVIMFLSVVFLGNLNLNMFVLLFLQIIIGMAIYLIISYTCKLSSFFLLRDLLKKLLLKKN